MDEGQRLEQAKRSFDAALNRHGYPFQYAVLSRTRDVFKTQRSRFYFETAEFPVVVQGEATSIDFILKHTEMNFFLVCECKRANPALADWCFLQAPFLTRDSAGSPHAIILDGLSMRVLPAVDASLDAIVVRQYNTFTAAQIALEVRRANEKGDPSGGSRSAIDGAATQVMRGLNGLIEFARARPEHFFEGQRRQSERAVFMPVIFTTATVYFSNVDLRATDVSTGTVDLSTASFDEKPWLVLQYHQTPNIKHSGQLIGRASRSLGDVLQNEFIRSIPIISPEGISDFLIWASSVVD